MLKLKNLKQVSLYGNWVIFKNHKIVEDMESKMPNCEFLTARKHIKNRKKKKHLITKNRSEKQLFLHYPNAYLDLTLLL